MTIEEIDKWLDNEYGVSYTSLEEIHDWLVDENMKKDKEIERLNNIINELERYIKEEYIYDDIGMKIFDASKLQDKLQELKGDSSNE